MGHHLQESYLDLLSIRHWKLDSNSVEVCTGITHIIVIEKFPMRSIEFVTQCQTLS